MSWWTCGEQWDVEVGSEVYREDMYIYGLFMLIYGRNYNTVFSKETVLIIK